MILLVLPFALAAQVVAVPVGWYIDCQRRRYQPMVDACLDGRLGAPS